MLPTLETEILFILAILFWAVIVGWIYPGFGFFGPFKAMLWNVKSLILKVTLLSNFIDGEQLSMSGPWWFISFIFQFYLYFSDVS